MSPKRILFLASWYPEPNAPAKGVFVLKHARALALINSVQLVYAREQMGISDYSIQDEIEGDLQKRIILYPQAKSGISANLAFLKAIKFGCSSLVKEGYSFDLIHANVLFPVGFYAWYLASKTKKPLIITEHLDLFLRDMIGVEKAPLPGRILRSFIHRRALFNTVCSRPMLSAFERFGLGENTEVWPNVVEFGPMPVAEFPPAIEGKYCLIHISSLRDDQKNITGILQALALLAKKRKDFSFHFIGSGSERAQHEQLAQQLGLLDAQVFFEGFVSEAEKQAWMQRSVGHIMQSHFEGFSVVTAEAIGAGLPVIVRNIGGQTDFVDSTNGYLIEREPQALFAAMDTLLDNFRSLDRVKMADEIRARFNPTQVAEDFNKLLLDYSS
jgi:glycosyltransferase involved in cell wall biosynthesis